MFIDSRLKSYFIYFVSNSMFNFRRIFDESRRMSPLFVVALFLLQMVTASDGYPLLQKLFHCFFETLSTYYLDSLWQSLKTSMTLIRTSLWRIVYFKSGLSNQGPTEKHEKDTIVDIYMKNTPLSDQYVSFAEMEEDLQKLGGSKPKF
jgi:hypothetical protein